MSLALLAACARNAPGWEDIEIAPKVIVSVLPGPEKVVFRLRNESGKDVILDAPNSWNVSMTLEGEKRSMAIDPPERDTRTTVVAGESREWDMATDSLLAEYRPKPHGSYQVRVAYDPNPKGLSPTFSHAITKLQTLYLP